MLIPENGNGDVDGDLIQSFPHGHLNWSTGILTVKSVIEPLGFNDDPSKYNQQLGLVLSQWMMESLSYIRVDSHRTLADLLEADDKIREKFIDITQTTPMHQYADSPNGKVEMAVKIQLYGGLAQLMLPADIRQVETITAVSSNAGGKDRNQTPRGASVHKAMEEHYTGLVVDARGLDVQPALVPVLVDENYQEVFGAAFVSREYAVQNGLSGYARSMRETDHRRVGKLPLCVKGLHKASGGLCDIVISNADAAKLRSASAHLAFLKKCRVLILLDNGNTSR
jgi:hypothetical protein